MWQRWIRRVAGQPYRKGVVRSVSIGGGIRCAQTAPAKYLVNLQTVIAYVCKGVDPRHAAMLGLLKSGDGGRVIGKRSAVCQALMRSQIEKSRVLPEQYAGSKR